MEFSVNNVPRLRIYGVDQDWCRKSMLNITLGTGHMDVKVGWFVGV